MNLNFRNLKEQLLKVRQIIINLVEMDSCGVFFGAKIVFSDGDLTKDYIDIKNWNFNQETVYRKLRKKYKEIINTDHLSIENIFKVVGKINIDYSTNNNDENDVQDCIYLKWENVIKLIELFIMKWYSSIELK